MYFLTQIRNIYFTSLLASTNIIKVWPEFWHVFTTYKNSSFFLYCSFTVRWACVPLFLRRFCNVTLHDSLTLSGLRGHIQLCQLPVPSHNKPATFLSLLPSTAPCHGITSRPQSAWECVSRASTGLRQTARLRQCGKGHQGKAWRHAALHWVLPHG